MSKTGEESLYFLGFDEPKERGAEGALMAIKNAVEKSVTWGNLFLSISSATSDGTNMNSGSVSGVWTKLSQMRVHLGIMFLLQLLKLHYLIRDASSLASYFHNSGVRTCELHKVAHDNNLKILRLPRYFEVQWSQYTGQLLRSIMSSIRAILLYLNTNAGTGAWDVW